MNRIHRRICRSTRWKRTLEKRLLPWVLEGTSLGRHVLEVGPGPGLATDYLRPRFNRITSVEIDPALAASLGQRLRDSNVGVVNGDATRLPFPECCFSGAISLTMLHHVPTPELQDRLLREVHRVLKPGACFVGSDSRANPALRVIHWFDDYAPVDPNTFGDRLRAAGFANVRVDCDRFAFRFFAQRL